MDFPRFTSGNVGALSFAHVNAIFERIERLEAESPGSSRSRASNQRGRMILARITGRNSVSAHSWVEAQRNASGNGFSDVESGARSTVGDDPFAMPIIGGRFENGEIVACFSRARASGEMYFEAVADDGAGLYIIIGNTGTGPIWLYNARAARWDSTSLRFVAVDGSPVVQMRNGAENPIDTATQIGVGTEIASGVTLTRMPIKNDTTVFAARSEDGTMTFSTPNGYRVQC